MKDRRWFLLHTNLGKLVILFVKMYESDHLGAIWRARKILSKLELKEGDDDFGEMSMDDVWELVKE